MKRRSPEDAAQALSFAYGNLACSTNHKPKRSAFKSVALKMGMTEAQFEGWAEGKEWWGEEPLRP